MSQQLLEVARQLATDEKFRAEFLADPRKHLADLGFSMETIDSLAAGLMTVLVTGSIILPPVVSRAKSLGWR